jgi:hypothetical protein
VTVALTDVPGDFQLDIAEPSIRIKSVGLRFLAKTYDTIGSDIVAAESEQGLVPEIDIGIAGIGVAAALRDL